MDSADPELGSGVWGTEHHVRRQTPRVKISGCAGGVIMPVLDILRMYCYINQGPKDWISFQPNNYHRRFVLTETFSQVLS